MASRSNNPGRPRNDQYTALSRGIIHPIDDETDQDNSIEALEYPVTVKRQKISPSPENEGVGWEDFEQEDDHDGGMGSDPSQWPWAAGSTAPLDEMDEGGEGEGDSDSRLLSGREFWTSPGAEEELCRLWQEATNLYDSSHPEHRDPQARKKSLLKIASLLKIPVKFINMRMQSLRTSFQKLAKEEENGNAPKRYTYRQKKIKRLCTFLIGHVKTTETSSNHSSSPSGVRRRRRGNHGVDANAIPGTTITGIYPNQNMEVFAPEISAAPLPPEDMYNGPEFSADEFGTEEDSKAWYNEQRKNTNHNKNGGKEAKQENTDNPMAEVVQEWSKMLQSMAKNVAVMAEVSQRRSAEVPETADSMWAKSLVAQMVKMDPRLKNRFMVHVYQLALDALQGEWPMPH